MGTFASMEASWLEPDDIRECTRCEGAGTVSCEECDGGGCECCMGGERTCGACEGSGVQGWPERLPDDVI